MTYEEVLQNTAGVETARVGETDLSFAIVDDDMWMACD